MKAVAILAQSTSYNIRYRRITTESLTMSSKRPSTEKVEKVVMHEEIQLKDFMREEKRIESVIAMQRCWHAAKRKTTQAFTEEKT